ncbi:PREDICTED: coiled-coil domain-containing protein 43 isoform X2 [Bactrocera latifrons]|uniref:coiled-coil domain-containing protein 43 isoform X2 n=1 Tax=Bactrocera latifrons TaxID=174628 RepID=UPI0008DE887C|nr:PREDICTED: coiled-coil domain-containing protein 43 isoform X2 [Bactrocera latifrons]
MKSKQSTNEFTSWLQKKLIELNTDPDIFGSYIAGILDGEEPLDEKREALNDILSEIITNDIDSLISLILEKFESAHPKEEKKTDGHIDVSEQLAKLLEVQKLPATTKTREYTEEERQIREQILAQYSQTEVEDVDTYCSDEDTEGSNVALAANSLTGIERNTNFQDVMALQKEKREQARLDSAAKKQKDKEDRERQKQLREEKKEKRKTVKGERRR